MWSKVVVILGMLLLALQPMSVSADALITITVVPYVGSGIVSFTAIVISDTEVDLSWDVDVNITNVMIRAKYSTMPMSRTDGYLVYEGDLSATTDTSMNLDETAGVLYYRIWGQTTEGVWIDYEVNSEGLEGLNVALIGSYIPLAVFFLGALALIVIYEINKQQTLGMLAGIFWMVSGAYCYYLHGTAANASLEILFQVLGFMGMLGGLMLAFITGISWSNERRNRKEEEYEKHRPLSFDEQILAQQESHQKPAIDINELARKKQDIQANKALRRYIKGEE